MKQLFFRGGAVVVDDVPPPTCGSHQVLVANVCSVISTGTERRAVRAGTASLLQKALRHPELVRLGLHKVCTDGIRSTLTLIQERGGEPRPSGYAAAGLVLSVGRQIAGVAPGQRVACGGAGYANHAEIIAAPRNLLAPIPPGVDFEAAAFTTLGAIAMQGLRRAELTFGETVVVLGLGLLGLLAVQIARAAGYRVIGLDIDDRRVTLARQLGAEAAFNSTTQDALTQIETLTDGVGADAVVIYAATPSSKPVNLAFDVCRQRGRVVAVGAFGMELDRERMYHKELDFVMSTSYGPGRYDLLYEEEGVDYPVGYVRWTENRNMQAFLSLLASGQVEVRPLISERFPIERAPEAYALLQGDARPLALLITYDLPAELPAPIRPPTPPICPPVLPVSGPIGVVVIGAGGFVRETHLPALKAQPADYRIAAIVSAHGEKAATVAQQYGAPLATTDHREALAAPGVHLALIGTRHHLHASMVLDALAAGLPVFCEKPLCLTPDELQEIRAAVAERGLPVWVGFNRRYSALAVTLKRAFDNLRRPALITYRVNAGFLPADHWTHDPPVGGGRLLGEGCHFFDFFHFLLDQPDAPVRPLEVSASVVPPGGGVVARDNFVVTIRYDDGSMATLIYAALANPDLPKERVEVHATGASLVLDDFKTLTGYGVALPGVAQRNLIRLRRQDKGIVQQWREIARALRGEPSQAISFDAVCRAMTLTFRAEEALRGER